MIPAERPLDFHIGLGTLLEDRTPNHSPTSPSRFITRLVAFQVGFWPSSGFCPRGANTRSLNNAGSLNNMEALNNTELLNNSVPRAKIDEDGNRAATCPLSLLLNLDPRPVCFPPSRLNLEPPPACWTAPRNVQESAASTPHPWSARVCAARVRVRICEK